MKCRAVRRESSLIIAVVLSVSLLFVTDSAFGDSDFTPIPPSLVRTWPPPSGPTTFFPPDSAALRAGGGDTWIATWQSYDDPQGDPIGYCVNWYARSTDDGVTWSAAATIPPAASPPISFCDDANAFDGDQAGNWAWIWERRDSALAAAISTNDGTTWSTVTFASGDADDVPVTHRQSPRISTDGAGTWVAVWTEILDGARRGSRTVFSRSTSGPLGPWSTPAPLNAGVDYTLSEPRGSLDSYQVAFVLGLARGGIGVWVAVVGEETLNPSPLLEDQFDIKVLRSSDNGATWSAPLSLPDGPATGDWRSGTSGALAVDPAGTFAVTWPEADHASAPTARRLLASTSTDGGVSWSPGVVITENPKAYAFEIASPAVGEFVAFGADSNPPGLDESDPSYRGRSARFWRSADDGASWDGGGSIDPNHDGTDSPVGAALSADADTDGNLGVLWQNYPPTLVSDLTRLWFSIAKGECGDGAISQDELCDDGNRESGDGCDSGCDVEQCWQCTGLPSTCSPVANGTSCSDGEPCTSGLTCTNGVCGGGTTLPDGTACDDFSVCNGSETCRSGVCTSSAAVICNACEVCSEQFGQCIPNAQQTGCHRPLPGLNLQLSLVQNFENPFKRKFKFKWRGTETTFAEFGDPAATTDLRICFGSARSYGQPDDCTTLRPAGICGGKSCWKTTSKGYSYKDARLGELGSFIKKLVLKEGPDGKATVIVAGGGRDLDLGSLENFALPAQVSVSTPTGAVWSATFGSGDLKKQNSKVLKLKGGS